MSTLQHCGHGRPRCRAGDWLVRQPQRHVQVVGCAHVAEEAHRPERQSSRQTAKRPGSLPATVGWPQFRAVPRVAFCGRPKGWLCTRLLVLSQPTRCLTSRSGKGAHRPLEPPACPAPAGTAGGWGAPPPSAIANAVTWLASRIVLSSADRDPTDCEGQSLIRARFALQDRRLTLSFRSSVSKDAICHTPLEGGRTHGSRPAEPDRRSPVSGIPS